MKRYIILIFMLLPMLALFAQKESRNVNAGNKHYKKEKFVESEVEYRKGLEQNNSSFSANFNLGDALYRQEKYEDAAEAFEMAISIYPQFYDALFNLRDTYLELGNKTGADECSAIMKNLKKSGTIYG